MNHSIKTVALVGLLTFSLGACQTTSGQADYVIKYDGKEIVNNKINEMPSIAKVFGLQPLQSQIPSYDGKGLLAASWNPSDDLFNNPTFVVMHGGHGLGHGMWLKAKLLKAKYNANVLLLDSFKSRGMPNNWHRGQDADAIVRTFDVIAVGKWLQANGTNPKKTYMMGGSQGGWTALKAMSAGKTQIAEVKPLYAGGIAYYPVCDNFNDNGNLRANQRFITLAKNGYWGPVLLLTGKKDYATPISGCQPAVVKHATKHVEFERGTHGWEIRWRDRSTGQLNAHGTCKWSGNKNFKMCFDEEHTNQMYDEIGKFAGVR